MPPILVEFTGPWHRQISKIWLTAVITEGTAGYWAAFDECERLAAGTGLYDRCRDVVALQQLS